MWFYPQSITSAEERFSFSFNRCLEMDALGCCDIMLYYTAIVHSSRRDYRLICFMNGIRSKSRLPVAMKLREG